MKFIRNKAILLAAVSVLLWGCGSTSGGSSSYEADSYSSYMAVSEEGKYEAEMEGIADYASYDNTYSEKTSSAETSEKLVYRGSVSVQTKEYKDAAQKLRAMVHEYNGVIESEDEYSEGSYYVQQEERNLWVLSLTVRIPTEQYEAFMNGTSDIGNVISRSSSVENISRRYNDVSAQIEALEKQQTRLLEMMDRADTIEDMIAVEDRLSEVQYELNSLKTDQTAMDTDVAYSTIYISLREVRVYTEVNETFVEKLGNRFVNGFSGFFNAVQELILSVVYALPYLLIAGILLYVLIHNRNKLPRISFLKKRKKEDEQI